MVTVPETEAGCTGGVNSIVTVSAWAPDGMTVPSEIVSSRLKLGSPESLTDWIVRGRFRLATETDKSLTCPMLTLPKAREAGVTLMPVTPVPVRLTEMAGETGSPVGIVTVADCDPDRPGVKVTLTVQEVQGARLVFEHVSPAPMPRYERRSVGARDRHLADIDVSVSRIRHGKDVRCRSVEVDRAIAVVRPRNYGYRRHDLEAQGRETEPPPVWNGQP